jgi:hypothetical protein
VVGHRLADTFEAAALEAINIFCDQHPNEVVGYSIGLFPAADSRDPSGHSEYHTLDTYWEI